MCCSYLADLSGVYFRVPVLISIVFGSLWVLYGWWVEYWGMCFRARHNMSLYKPLITLVQLAIISGNLTPIKVVFSLGFKDSTS